MLSGHKKDYAMPFKQVVVCEVEETCGGVCAAVRKYRIQSETTVTTWLRKFGNLTIKIILLAR